MPLDVATGALGETGLMASWLECSAHPTTAEPFAGKTIPAFEQCLRTVISHHQRIPFVGAVGWDVTVDSDEAVQILEWNGFHNGIGFSKPPMSVLSDLVERLPIAAVESGLSALLRALAPALSCS